MSTPNQITNICKNCGHQFTEKYCNKCGEKVIDDHERTFSHFIGEVFHTLTHADGKIFKALKWILINPGLLSEKYTQGIRQSVIKPVSLFFVCNLIFFLVPLTTLFNEPLGGDTIEHLNYSSWSRPMVEKKLKDKNIDFANYKEKFHAKSSTLSKFMLILFVPAMAIILGLVNMKKKEFFADHVVIALEFMAFMLFYGVTCTVLIIAVLANILIFTGTYFDQSWLNEVFEPVLALAIIYFLFRAHRKYYQDNIFIALIKSAFLLIGFIYIYKAYEYLLFFTTLVIA